MHYSYDPTGFSLTHCGIVFTADYLLSCPTGGFPTIQHNELRDLTASMLSEVCHNVSIKPQLQPLTGETLNLASANSTQEARLDITANGVWGSRFERSFFDVWVINLFSISNRHSSLSAAYRLHEEAKKRSYQQRVLDVEQSSFTPL